MERKGGEEGEPLVHVVRRVHWWEEYERCLEERTKGKVERKVAVTRRDYNSASSR